MKKRLFLGLLICLLLTGCGPAQAPESQADPSPVQLRYYTIGRADPDLPLVNEALNDLLLERYGFTVDYRKIDWNEYENTMNGILNTDQNFDVMFTWDSHYARYAQSGDFLDLEPYLKGEGRELWDALDPRFWQGVRIGGRICGVPTNKELAPVVQFLFSRELVEKYQMDVSRYTTIEALEPLLRQISHSEPQVVPLMFTSERVDLAQLLGFEYVVGGDLPLVVRSGDPDCRILNLYETPEMQSLQATLRRFYTDGLINADATVRTAISRFEGEQAFCRIASGGPEADASFSVDFGYPILSQFASEPWITNSSARGGIMAISAGTRHPQEALTFLRAVNLDPEVRNLLNYGIEGTHYRLNDQDQVEVLSDRYRGVPYTQGNWFLLKTMAGEDPDKWQQYEEYNRQARTSYLLGFQPDLTGLEQPCSQVSKIYRQFDNPLLTGSVSPEYHRGLALERMEAAGVDDLIQNLQQQVDRWLGMTPPEGEMPHE